MNNEIIDAYKKSTIDLVEWFVKRFLKDSLEEWDKLDYYIIWDFGKSWPSVVSVQDFYFFDISDIFIFEKYNISNKIIEDWYEKKVRNWLKNKEFKWIFEYYEEKTVPKNELERRKKEDLEKSEEKVIDSLKEFYTLLWVSEEKINEKIKEIKKT